MKYDDDDAMMNTKKRKATESNNKRPLFCVVRRDYANPRSSNSYYHDVEGERVVDVCITRDDASEVAFSIVTNTAEFKAWAKRDLRKGALSYSTADEPYHRRLCHRSKLIDIYVKELTFAAMEEYCIEHPSEAKYLRELVARAKAKAAELGFCLLGDEGGNKKKCRDEIGWKGASSKGVAKRTCVEDGKSLNEDAELAKKYKKKVVDDAIKKYQRALHPELAGDPPGLPTDRKLWTLQILGVPLPSHGETYDVEEAVKYIQKFPKRSQERGAVIELMLEGGYLQVKRTLLYKLLRRSENSNEKPPSESVTKKQHIGLGYEGDFVRPGIRQCIAWKGKIVLSVIPVTFCQRDSAWPGCGHRPCGQSTRMFHFDLQEHLRNTSPQFIDICSLVGNSDMYSRVGSASTLEHSISLPTDIPQCMHMQDPRMYPECHPFSRVCKRRGETRMTLILNRRKYMGHTEKRVSKLYFDPAKYPPPSNPVAFDSIVFGHLRNYIENAAENYGSPVNCNGGKSNDRLFRCRFWPRGETKERWSCNHSHGCTLSFRVSWDEFGYFIDLNRNEWDTHNNGCGWHSCLTRNPKCLGI